MSSCARAAVTTDTPAVALSTVQRACACGAAAGAAGRCPSCAAEAQLGVQPKLRINPPGDRWEQEADRVAEQVMSERPVPLSGPLPITPLVQRQPDAEEEEKVAVQAWCAGTPGSTAALGDGFARDLAAEARGGTPLDLPTRTFFASRFGRDLAAVRLHIGPRAARLSRAIDARAFTHQNHIFAAGEIDTRSSEGRRLLAHELTHVQQQLPGGHLLQRRRPEGNVPETAPEVQPATPEERREFARTAAEFLRNQGDFFVEQPGRSLEGILDALNRSARGGLGAVEGLSGAEAEAGSIRAAYREAVRKVLVSRTRADPSAIRTPPTLPELYEQHRDEILPFALPQHEAARGASELSAELEAPLPSDASGEERARHAAVAQARQSLRVVTTSVQLEIEPLFDTQGARMTIALPQNTSVRFATNVPSTLQHGLRNVAAQLIDAALTANTTVMLALDLTRHGGGYDSYRFTRLDLGGSYGTEVLIERQGAVGVEGLRTEQRREMRDRFDRLGFRRGSGFDDDEFDQVLIGLSAVPETQLATLGNLRFERDTADPQTPAASAHYDQSAHTIRVFDRAFSSRDLTRVGGGGRPLRLAAAAIVHEIGHALDLAALRTTAAATEAAQHALLAEFGTGGGRYQIPARGAPDRPRYDVLSGAVSAAETAERAARARSGARWQGGRVTDAVARGARQPAFRAAAVRDGASPPSRGFPTTYPNPDSFWQEYFAEAFMLYQTSPELLQRLRPNVFAFMQQEFPSASPGGTPNP